MEKIEDDSFGLLGWIVLLFIIFLISHQYAMHQKMQRIQCDLWNATNGLIENSPCNARGIVEETIDMITGYRNF